jgi:hypothetical protein
VAVLVGVGVGVLVGVAVGVAVGGSERITSGRKVTVVGTMTVVCADAGVNRRNVRVITNATPKMNSRLTGTKKRRMNHSLLTLAKVIIAFAACFLETFARVSKQG